MLGEAFHTQFKADFDLKCSDKDVNEDWLSFLDFRDAEAYEKDVKEFNPDYIYKTYIEPLGQVGKEKSPEEKAKSKAESEQIYSDIKQTLKSQPEFDTVEQAKTKITNFIQK